MLFLPSCYSLFAVKLDGSPLTDTVVLDTTFEVRFIRGLTNYIVRLFYRTLVLLTPLYNILFCPFIAHVDIERNINGFIIYSLILISSVADSYS